MLYSFLSKLKSVIRVIVAFPSDFWLMFVTYLPGNSGRVLRRFYWKNRLKYIGKDVNIDVGVYFQNPSLISLGNNCWIDRNVIILAGISTRKRATLTKEVLKFKLKVGEVYIGENTHIAPNCVLSGIGGLYIGKNCGVASNSTIYSFSHHYRNLEDKSDNTQYSFTPLARLDQQAMISAPVVISDFCAVGLNSTILPGTTLNEGTWIASNMVVSGEFQNQSLVFSKTSTLKKDISFLSIKQ